VKDALLHLLKAPLSMLFNLLFQPIDALYKVPFHVSNGADTD
jgi:hypothetical protein